MRVLLIGAGVLVVLGVSAGDSLVERRKEMEGQREAILRAWSQVDTALERRADLVPSLVAIVKGFAAQEGSVCDRVAQARAAAAGGRTPAERIAAHEQLSEALARLLAAVENYPQLKSNESLRRLQDELLVLENLIAIERRKYNEVVQTYNTSIQLFPNNLVASWSGLAREEAYFRTGDAAREAPRVRF